MSSGVVADTRWTQQKKFLDCFHILASVGFIEKRCGMLTNWHQCFPGCEPVAHHLRRAFPDRWVRFHSLPGSKSHPEVEAEYATIVARHNCILGELAHDGDPVALLTTGWSDTPKPIRSEADLSPFDPQAIPWRTVAMHEHQKDYWPNFWHVFVSERSWKPGLFDSLVRMTAIDDRFNIMIVALDCRWLMHPYAGGMDVILESNAARDRLKANHLEWLSARADGL